MARVNVPITELGFVKAALTTALTGTNNDLVFTAKDGGPGGNEITVQYVVSGTNTALACAVNGKAIVVTVATNGGGAATSTSAQVKAKVEATADASSLVTVAHAASNDGTGVVTSLSATPLTGGALSVARPSQTVSDATNDMVITGNDGNVHIEVENANAGSQTIEFELAPKVAKGLAVAAGKQTESITAGAFRVFGPFPPGLFNQNAAGDVYFNPSVSTDLKFRAYRSNRAT